MQKLLIKLYSEVFFVKLRHMKENQEQWLFVETKTVTWDGQPVLQDFPSDFTVPGIVDMQ